MRNKDQTQTLYKEPLNPKQTHTGPQLTNLKHRPHEGSASCIPHFHHKSWCVCGPSTAQASKYMGAQPTCSPYKGAKPSLETWGLRDQDLVSKSLDSECSSTTLPYSKCLDPNMWGPTQLGRTGGKDLPPCERSHHFPSQRTPIHSDLPALPIFIFIFLMVFCSLLPSGSLGGEQKGMRTWKNEIHESHRAKNLICDKVCSGSAYNGMLQEQQGCDARGDLTKPGKRKKKIKFSYCSPLSILVISAPRNRVNRNKRN